jgi:hypothetical protein
MTRRRWVVLTLLTGVVACGGITDTGAPAADIVGSWKYTGTYSGAPTTIDAVLKLTPQSGARFAGTFDAEEVDARGTRSHIIGVVSGTAVDLSTLDFDVSLQGASRHHMARVHGDSITGTWIETDASSITATGTFRAARTAR